MSVIPALNAFFGLDHVENSKLGENVLYLSARPLTVAIRDLNGDRLTPTAICILRKYVATP